MTNLDIYKALHYWATTVLGNDVQVIQAFQNAPRAEVPQVAIGLPSGTPYGHSTTSVPPTFANGVLTQTAITNYEATVNLWETGSQGDALRALVESLDLDMWTDYFSNLGMAVDTPVGIQWVPRLDEKSFIQECTTQLSVTYTGTASENFKTINSTKFTKTP